jgi:hypothetical protein
VIAAAIDDVLEDFIILNGLPLDADLQLSLHDFITGYAAHHRWRQSHLTSVLASSLAHSEDQTSAAY